MKDQVQSHYDAIATAMLENEDVESDMQIAWLQIKNLELSKPCRVYLGDDMSTIHGKAKSTQPYCVTVDAYKLGLPEFVGICNSHQLATIVLSFAKGYHVSGLLKHNEVFEMRIKAISDEPVRLMSRVLSNAQAATVSASMKSNLSPSEIRHYQPDLLGSQTGMVQVLFPDSANYLPGEKYHLSDMDQEIHPFSVT